MKSFKALYRPAVVDSQGNVISHNNERVLRVVVIKLRMYEDIHRPAEAMYINDSGDIGIDTLDCFQATAMER